MRLVFLSSTSILITFTGNQHLNEASFQYMNEVNLAWIGTSPGVEVRDSLVYRLH